MPLGRLLVRVPRLRPRAFFTRPADELQAERQPLSAEAAGHRDRWTAGEVKRYGVTQQHLDALTRKDSLGGKVLERHRHCRHRWTEQQINLLQQVIDLAADHLASYVGLGEVEAADL